jgi:hypothetical protein
VYYVEADINGQIEMQRDIVFSPDYRNEKRWAIDIFLVVLQYALMDLSEQKMHVRQAA